MKKILSVIIVLFSFTSLFYAEHIISVSPFLSIGKTDFTDTDEDYSIVSTKVQFSADYKYLLDNGFLFGAQLSIFPDIIRFGSTSGALNGVVLEYTGFGMDFSHVVGYRFGKNHLIGLELLPINFAFTNFKGNATASKTVGNSTYNLDVPLSLDIYTLSTIIRANVQFGSSLVRNGFVVGFGIPWYLKLSDFRIENSPRVTESYKSSGFFLIIGYKLSFVI